MNPIKITSPRIARRATTNASLALGIESNEIHSNRSPRDERDATTRPSMEWIDRGTARVIVRTRSRAAMRAVDRTRAFREMCASSSMATITSAMGAAVEPRASNRGADDDDLRAKSVTCRTVLRYAETAVRALGTTRAYVEAHGRGYKSASDEERDAFEAETSASIRECQRAWAPRETRWNGRDAAGR